MINIAHRNVLESYKYFGPMPHEAHIREPPVEPGMEIVNVSNGTQQRTLVERVEFGKHLGVYPEWKLYSHDSRIHLDPNLELKASWPEGGLQPYFKKGFEFDLPDKAGNRVRYRVLTQSSLDESADVYFVNALFSKLFWGFVAYKIPRLKLQEILDSYRSDGSSPEELAVPARGHHRRC